MIISLDHDEHQYLLSGYLLAKKGLLPYSDYPYFQLPNISFVYAVLASCTNHLFLSARMLAVLTSVGIAVLLYANVLHLFKEEQKWKMHLLATAIVLLLYMNPLFNYAAWKSWTHSFPLFFTLLATYLFLKNDNCLLKRSTVFWIGFCLSLALGTRISYVFFIPVFALFIFFHTSYQQLSERFRSLLYFTAGGTLAAIPTLYLWLSNPSAFWFDVVAYHTEVDTAYFEDLNKVMDFSALWSFFVKNITRAGNEYFTYYFALLLLVATGMSIWNNRSLAKGFYFNFLLLVCALLPAFSKVISFPQYFFSYVPFLLLAAVYLLRALSFTWALVLLVAFSLLVNVQLSFQWRLEHFLPISNWKAVQFHHDSQRIRPFIENEKVLTLSPLHIVEGKGEIYPALATGPFAWRTHYLVSEAQRLQSKFMGATELEKHLKEQPPDAVYTGWEGRHEKYFEHYAIQNKFRNVRYLHDGKFNLWLPASRFEETLIEQKSDTIEYLTAAYSQSIHLSIDSILAEINSDSFVLFSEVEIETEQDIAAGQLFLVMEIRKDAKKLFWKGDRLGTRNESISLDNRHFCSPMHLFDRQELLDAEEIVVFLWNPKKVPVEIHNLRLSYGNLR